MFDGGKNIAGVVVRFCCRLASLDLALTAFAATQNAATESVAKVIQTATLKPTKEFTGTKLQFSFADRYATQLSGSGYVGKAVVCPFIAQLNFNLRQIFSSNGQGGGTLHQQLVLKKSSAGFKLTFAMEVGAVVGGGSGKAGAVTSSYPTSTLPQGLDVQVRFGERLPVMCAEHPHGQGCTFHSLLFFN